MYLHSSSESLQSTTQKIQIKSDFNLFCKQMKNRIKELRAQYNLTQQDLANEVGVRRETIVFLELGKYNPSLKLAFLIARRFERSIEEVFYLEVADL